MRPFGLLKTVVAMFMAMAVCLPFAKAQVTGNGTEANPYVISTKTDLVNLQKCLELYSGGDFYFNGGTFTKTAGGTTIPAGAEGIYFELGADIVVNEGEVSACNGAKEPGWVEWKTDIFSGHFDGKNHTISGLYYSDPTSTRGMGLFGQIQGAASVRNLGVVNSFFRGKNQIGGIAGVMNGNETKGNIITNCFFEGSLDVAVTGTQYCGGICGRTFTNDTIMNCYSTGSIYTLGNTNTEVGGIVGYNYSNAEVSNCYSSMMVDCISGSSGGVYGTNRGSVSTCFYDMQMTDKPSSGANVGRLTVYMTADSWTYLGDAFVTEEGLYPRLASFDINTRGVLLSVIPLKLGSTSSTDYKTMSNLRADFPVTSHPSITWSMSSTSNVAVLEGGVVKLKSQGVAYLIATDNNTPAQTRTYILFPKVGDAMGTINNPYTIDNINDLKAFRDGVNYGVDFVYKRVLVHALTIGETYWLQTDTIDLAVDEDEFWTPIGSKNHPFTAHYDGGGNEIVNMKLKGTAQAFIVCPNKATIRRLGIRNPIINCGANSGALATLVMEGTIDSCYLTGDAASLTYSGDYCGGLIGDVGEGTTTRAKTVTISNCYNNCDVKQTARGSLGGVVGHVYGEDVTVIRCYNTGDVTSYIPTSSASWRSFGGVVGHMEGNALENSATVKFCYNTGNITAYYGFIGGVVGITYRSDHIVSHCFNTGTVTDHVLWNSRDYVSLGGIVSPFGGASVNYCFNSGKLIVKSDANYSVVNTKKITGIATTASQSFNVGEIINENLFVYTYGVSSNASYSYNAARLTPPIYGHQVYATGGATCYYDKNLTIDGTGGTACTTAQLMGIGSVAKGDTKLSETYWIFEEGRYPRLRWTDSLDWARDVAIAACTPVLLKEADGDIDHVKPGVKLYGCNNDVTWTQDGCLFTDLATATCAHDTLKPTVNSSCTGSTILTASIHGKKVKALTLNPYVAPAVAPLTIDSVGDLTALRNGINTGGTFMYKDTLIPRFAEGVTFRLTKDLTLEGNWIPIGVEENYFSGVFDGFGHTISNVNCDNSYSMAGLFGNLRGTVQDLNVKVNLTGGQYKGGICAKMNGAKVSGCTASGTIDGSAKSYVHAGGIVGTASAGDTIINCKSFVDITGPTAIFYNSQYAYIGGIVGQAVNSATPADRTHILYCINAGEIKGSANCTYIGGISGLGTPRLSFNTGTVTADVGVATLNRFVGGITGDCNLSGTGDTVCYCYNAALVDGGNCKYVGGLCGRGKAAYSYNSNTVLSTGTYKGSLCGYGSAYYCNYDKQLSLLGGVNNLPENDSRGKLSEKMRGDQLKSRLGDANWNYTDCSGNFLPQLKYFAGTDISRSSVMPLCPASTNDTIYQVYNRVVNNIALYDYKIGATCEWEVVQGNSINIQEVSGNLTGVVNGRQGIVVLGAKVNGTVYRQVKVRTNLTESTPLLIKDVAELKNFRDVINDTAGYYISSTEHFQKAKPGGDTVYVEIRDGGADLFFQLKDNTFDLSDVADWTPIGDFTNGYSFKGTFLGNNQTISGLKLTSKNDYRGLFGYIDGGTVRDLTIDRAYISNKMGYKGALCGANTNGGLLENCKVTNSKTSADAAYNSGILCGQNSYSTIHKCAGESDTICFVNDRIGGLCGNNYFGLIDSSYSRNLYMTGSGTYKGGIAGYNDKSTIRSCALYDSHIEVESSQVGGICGRSNSDQEGSSVVDTCVNLNSIVKTTLASGKPEAYIGGIVGYNYRDNGGNVDVTHCYVSGGLVEATAKSYVGGIVGYIGGNASDSRKLRYCTNESTVKGVTYVGGIAGWLQYVPAQYCYNYGDVFATGSVVGGIAGELYYYGRIEYCGNAGNVHGDKDMVGGLAGRITYNNQTSYISNSFNTGIVSGVNQVGGIIGLYSNNKSYVRYCYNAGIVRGVSQVGGIAGAQKVVNMETTHHNYNIGWVEGASMCGSICGYTPDATVFTNNYYDSQMSHYASMGNEDMGSNAPKLISQFMGSGMVATLGGADKWLATDGMYPRLKGTDTSAAAIGSAFPVRLPVTSTDTIRAADLPYGDYTLGGCDTVAWEEVDGYGYSIAGCNLHVAGRNTISIANTLNGRRIKTVHLVLAISEDNPLDIISLEQFKKFRNLVNSNQTFYYDQVNQIFLESPGPGYIEIPPGGEDMYFRLTTDIDLSVETVDWVPIGNSSTIIFKGNFNGDNHTITGMTISGNGDYKGLFGNLQGSVKNVIMVSPSITGTGSYHGSIAGRNAGTIENSGSLRGTVKGTSYVGGLVGWNFYNTVRDCYNGSNVEGTDHVGGITGSCTAEGIITRSFNTGVVTATKATECYAGGIAGHTAGEISVCYNAGTINGSTHLGGIAGWTLTPYLHHCYNVGFVHSSIEDNKTYMGGIAAGNDAAYYPYYCYFDKQLCPVDGCIGLETYAGNITHHTDGFFTTEIVGNGLKDYFGEEDWEYNDGEYPRLKSLKDLDLTEVSVQPVFFQELEPINKLGRPFTVPIDDVAWSRFGSGFALNFSDAEHGNINLSICGPDTLRVTKNNDYRILPLYVKDLSAATLVDTACGYYLWAAAGRVFTQSADVTISVSISEGCDSVMSLRLTIPPELSISMASQNRTCYNYTDDYAEATVSGGFERGYSYAWRKDGSDEVISTTNRIEGQGAGLYHLTISDSIYPACKKTADVTITVPDTFFAAITDYDSHCYNLNDGEIDFYVERGTMPYTVSWTGAATGSLPPISSITRVDGTITNLADGTYEVSLTDANGCNPHGVVNPRSIEIADNEEEHSITAVGVNKKFDGVEVDLRNFELQIGSNPPEIIASGGYKVLANGDTLYATVSRNTPADVVVDYTTGTTNTVTSWRVSKDGEDRSCRYNVTTHSSPVEIAKRTVILTSATDSREFISGTPLFNHTVTITGDGFVAPDDTLSTSGWQSITNAGSIVNDFTYTLNTSAQSNFDKGNYTITQRKGNLSISAEDEILLIAGSDEKLYDGSALSAGTYTPVGLHSGDVLVGVTVTGSQLEAGTSANVIDTLSTFDVRSSDNSESHRANYTKVTLQNGTLTVNKRQVTLTTTGASKEYDGTPLTSPAVSISGDGFADADGVTVTHHAPITTPETVEDNIIITGNANYDEDANYIITRNVGTLAVSKRHLAISAADRSVAYNGLEQKDTIFYAPALLSGHTIKGLTYEAKGTTVGTYHGSYNNVFTIEDGGHNNVTSYYDTVKTAGTLTITNIQLPLVVRSNSNVSDSVIYDGQIHTYRNYTVLYNNVSLAPTQDTIFTLPTGDKLIMHPVGKGRGIVNVSESGKNQYEMELQHASNYDPAFITCDTGNLVILRRPVTLISNSFQSVYDGQYHPSVIADMDYVRREGRGFVGIDEVRVTMLSREKNVGVYTDDFTYVAAGATNLANYDITVSKGNIVITKAPLTIKADNKERVYGEVDPPFTYSITGYVAGESSSNVDFVGTARPKLVPTSTIQSPAGTYAINVVDTGIVFANYSVQTEPGTLKITRRQVGLTAKSFDAGDYTGEERTWQEITPPYYTITPGSTSFLAGDTITSVIVTGARTVAGSTSIELSNAVVQQKEEGTPMADWLNVSNSYEFTITPGALTINPKNLKIKPKPYTHEFTGDTYSSIETEDPHYDIVDGTSLAPTDSIVVININGSRAAPGKTPFLIDPSSLKIINRLCEDCDLNNPENLRNNGYDITYLTDTLEITSRTTPYNITMTGNSDSVTYNANDQRSAVSGFVTTTFTVNGHVFTVSGLTSTVNGEAIHAGTYDTEMNGTAVVRDVNNQDVTSEFAISYVSGKLKIKKHDLTIAPGGLTTEYDGAMHKYSEVLITSTNSWYAIEGLQGLDRVDTIPATGQGRATGNYPIDVDESSIVLKHESHGIVTDNYNITVWDTTYIRITPRTNKDTLVLVSKSDSICYDGVAHVLSGFDTLTFTSMTGRNHNIPAHFYIKPENVSATTVTTKDAGTYDNVITVSSASPYEGQIKVYDEDDEDVTDQFIVQQTVGQMKIGKRPLTLTPRDTSWVFDANTHRFASFTLNDNGTETVVRPATADATSSSIVLSSTGDNLTVNFLLANSDYCEITNYNVEGVYNRINSHTLTNGTDVSGNYLVTVAPEARLRIIPDTITIKANGNEFTYDGNMHYEDGYTLLPATIPGNPTITALTNRRAALTNNGVKYVGSYVNGIESHDFTSGVAANYYVKYDTDTLKVKYGTPLALSITAKSGSWVYDGAAHTKDSCVVVCDGTTYQVGPDGDVTLTSYGDLLHVNITGSIDTVGSVENVVVTDWTITNGGNDVRGAYATPTLTNGTLTLTTRATTITANSATKSYDGTPLTNNGWNDIPPTNIASTDHVESVVVTGSQTEVGNSANVPSAAVIKRGSEDVTRSYDITYADGNLEVTGSTKNFSITSADGSFVYDNTPHTKPEYTVTYDGANVSALAGSDGKWFRLPTGDTIKITPAASASVTKVADNAANNNTFTYTLGHDIAYTGTRDTVFGTLTITPRPVNVTANNYSVMYDGQAHSYAENTSAILTVEAETTGRGLLSVHHVSDTTMTGSRTLAGQENIVITDVRFADAGNEDVTANYTPAYNPGTLTITKRTGVEVKIQEHGKEVDFNNDFQQVTGYTVVSITDAPVNIYSVNDFHYVGPSGDTIAKGRDAGFYSMTLAPTDFHNDNDNYDEVTFTILDSGLYIYPELAVTYTTTLVSCNSANGGNHADGTATITVTGGRQKNNAKYAFVINTSGSTPVDSVSPKHYTLAKGNYTVTVTDSLGYSKVVTFAIEEPTEMTATISVPATDARCPNQGSYPVSATANGSNGGYTYAWGGGETFANPALQSTTITQNGTNDCSHAYTANVTVTDSKSCTVTATNSFTVVDNDIPVFDASLITETNAANDGHCGYSYPDLREIVRAATSDNCTANSALVVTQSPVQGTPIAITDVAQTLTDTVTVKDSCGKTNTVVINVKVPARLTAAITAKTEETCDGNDGTATVTASGGTQFETGGTPYYEYLWSSNAQPTQTATALSEGRYYVTVTDAHGCTTIANDTIYLHNPYASLPDRDTTIAICSGVEFSVTPDYMPDASTTYDWTYTTSSSSLSGMANGTDQSSVHGILTNSAPTYQTVVYQVDPIYGICHGSHWTIFVDVTVNVNPVISATLSSNTPSCAATDAVLTANIQHINSIYNVVWNFNGTPVETMSNVRVPSANDTVLSVTIPADFSSCTGTYNWSISYTDASQCASTVAETHVVAIPEWHITPDSVSTSVECFAAVVAPTSLLPVVKDGCNNTLTPSDPVISRRTYKNCDDTITYTYTYTACDNSFKKWHYTYVVKDNAMPVIESGYPTVVKASVTSCTFTYPDLRDTIRRYATDNCTSNSGLVIVQNPAQGSQRTPTATADTVTVTFTVTDSCDNVNDAASIRVAFPAQLMLDVLDSAALCYGEDDNYIKVEVKGGTPDYRLNVIGNTNREHYPMSAPGEYTFENLRDDHNYTVVVRDANACEARVENIDVYQITEPLRFTAYSHEWNYDGTTHIMDSCTVVYGSLTKKVRSLDTVVLANGDKVVPTVTGSVTEVNEGIVANVVNCKVLRGTDEITCYYDTIFVSGTLRVYETLVAEATDTFAISCNRETTGEHMDGKVVIRVQGGKPGSPRYWLSIDGGAQVTTTETYTFQDLAYGEHRVIITDLLQYKDTVDFFIKEPTKLTADITVPTSASGLCPNQVSYPVSVAADGSNGTYNYAWMADATNVDDINTVVTRVLANDCGHEYTAMVRVRDVKGCEVLDTATFTVVDTVRPTFDRPANITFYKNASCVADTSTAVAGEPTEVKDNCSPIEKITVTHRDEAHVDDCEGSYHFNRIWRVVDNCGNVSVSDSIQVITVEDTTRPTFTVPNDTTICRVNGQIVAPIEVTGDVTDEADNCTSSLDATWNDLDTLPVANSGNRIIRRQWTLTDDCTNTTQKIQKITIRPSVLTPGNITFTCPDTTVVLKYGVCDTLIELHRTLVNNMTDMNVVLDSFYVPYNHRYSADLSPDTIVWRITDECNDYVEYKQIVTVKYPPCGGAFMAGPDGDDHYYKTAQVGCNCWMAQNMRTTRYVGSTTTITPAPMQYPGTEQHPEDTIYGKLYTYSAATGITTPAPTPMPSPMAAPGSRMLRSGSGGGAPSQVQGICPAGWHVPDDEDFVDLMAHYDEAQGLMTTEYWLTTQDNTNSTDFSLVPSGMYNANLERYEYLYVQAYLWSYTPESTIYHTCQFGSACGTIEIIPATAANGYSVRCVRDTED